MNEPIKVFISYSHQDDELRKELSSHLSGLCQTQLIEPWHDRNIDAGSGWAEAIDQNLERAQIILLLVSSDFINSRYCYSIEMNQALERHRAGSAVVIPVIVRDSVWTSSPLGSLQAVPRDNQAVALRGDKYARDTAWKEVTVEIGKVAQKLKDQRVAELTATQKMKAIKEFRAKAERYYQDGAISSAEREVLDIDRQALGLGEPEAAEILEAVAAAYQQRQFNLEKYQKTFVDELAGQESVRIDQRVVLQDLQMALGISDAEVEQVEQKVLAERDLERQQAQAAADSQEAQELLEQQEAAAKREQNLQKFREELQRAVDAEYPLNNHVESGLRNFQLSLKLTDADVAPIKAHVLAIPEAAYQEQVRQRAELERQRQTELEQQRQAEKQTELGQARASEATSSQNQPSFKTFNFDVITVNWLGNENSRISKTAKFFSEDLGNQVLLEMVKIPGGTFQMGSEEGKGEENEKPQHSVTVPSFLMGKYPVTQAQWRVVAYSLPQEDIPLNGDPSFFKGDSRPVENVTWHESVEFCQRLSRQTGHAYRLPSEAEWEYACRARTKTEFYFGKTLTPKLARFQANLGMALFASFGGTVPVGSYSPNTFGLHDMHGNVWEWCADHGHNNYQNAPIDDMAWLQYGDSSTRVIRGGSWPDVSSFCRAASRIYDSAGSRSNNVGFRLVCAVFPALL